MTTRNNNLGGNPNNHYLHFLSFHVWKKDEPVFVLCGVTPKHYCLSNQIKQRFLSDDLSDHEMALLTAEIYNRVALDLAEFQTSRLPLYGNICFPESIGALPVYNYFLESIWSESVDAVSTFQTLFDMGTWAGQDSLDSEALKQHVIGEYWKAVSCLIQDRTKLHLKQLLKCVLRGANSDQIDNFYNNIAPQHVYNTPRQGLIPMYTLCLATLITPSLFKTGEGTIYFFKNKKDIPRYSNKIRKKVKELALDKETIFEIYENSLSSFFASIELDENLLYVVPIRTAFQSFLLSIPKLLDLDFMKEKYPDKKATLKEIRTKDADVLNIIKREKIAIKSLTIDLSSIKTRAQRETESQTNS